MTIEEKARAYDEALEIARKSWLDNQEPGYKRYRELLEPMFPELCESEDERVRKALTEHFKEIDKCRDEDETFYGIPYPNIIAWLEKQKEQNSVPSRETILGIWELGNFWKENPEERGGLTQLQYIQKYWTEKCDYQKEQKPAQEKLSYEEIVRNAEEEVNVLYPNNEEEGTEAWERRECLREHYMKGAVQAAMESLSIKEQKPVPKFKVGDLVKDVNHHACPVYKIIGTDDECYICKSDDATLGDRAVMHFTFDNPYLRLVNPKPAEWGEGEITHLYTLASFIKSSGYEDDGEFLEGIANELKSLRPSWKPSEDEMAALKEASASWMNEKMGNAELLQSLYDGLKKNAL